MELNLENDLILDCIYQLHMFVYEHLFLVNRIIPMNEFVLKYFNLSLPIMRFLLSIRLRVVLYH
jgi:hypothetical protein